MAAPPWRFGGGPLKVRALEEGLLNWKQSQRAGTKVAEGASGNARAALPDFVARENGTPYRPGQQTLPAVRGNTQPSAIDMSRGSDGSWSRSTDWVAGEAPGQTFGPGMAPVPPLANPPAVIPRGGAVVPYTPKTAPLNNIDAETSERIKHLKNKGILSNGKEDVKTSKGLLAGLQEHVLSGGFGSSLVKNIGAGAGGGLIGGFLYGGASAIDSSKFESNGILKPMLQGAWKGALVSAVHAGAGGIHKAQLPNKYDSLSRGAKMTMNAIDHKLMRGALMVASAGGAGNVHTGAVNQIK